MGGGSAAVAATMGTGTDELYARECSVDVIWEEEPRCEDGGGAAALGSGVAAGRWEANGSNAAALERACTAAAVKYPGDGDKSTFDAMLPLLRAIRDDTPDREN